MSGGGKHSRKDISSKLSHAVSIEEIVVDTVKEMLAKPEEDVLKAFESSDCRKMLFAFDTEYYLNDLNIIVADFLRECRTKLNWELPEVEKKAVDDELSTKS